LPAALPAGLRGAAGAADFFLLAMTTSPEISVT
jgi:hypothetical protein